ncbi:unnamed protein product [Cutaneotrichosporon oleaginosum]
MFSLTFSMVLNSRTPTTPMPARTPPPANASDADTDVTDAATVVPVFARGSVSTQLQDWLAARSLAISLPHRTPVDPKTVEQPARRKTKPKPKPKTTYDPASPSDVINFSLDATERLSWTSLLVVLLILPSALVYAVFLRLISTAAWLTAALWTPLSEFWYALLSYPSDTAQRRAYLLRAAARTTLILRAWLFLASRFGFGFGFGFLPVPAWRLTPTFTWASLALALALAICPIAALAALVAAILAPIKVIGHHLWRYGPAYVFLVMVAANGYGVYLLVRYVNAHEAPRGPKQVMRELEGLRAELEGLRKAGNA